MQPFRLLFFDIVGNCNAHCPYCLTGAAGGGPKTAIPSGLFSRTLTKLLEVKAVDSSTTVNLFNWGEPFLHPDLDSIIEVINDLKLGYGLSTNASIRRDITSLMTPNLRNLIISMHGFSQASYDRVSRLTFEHVKANIRDLVTGLRSKGYRRPISIAFHVYQFNIHELKACEQFCRELGVALTPSYAILAEWWLLQGWLKKTLSMDQITKISEDLFCFAIREKMSMSPKGYRCPQFDYLVIDENANVVVCCQTPKYKQEFLCGNILDDSIETIMANKATRQVCIECLDSGLSYYLNNSLECTEFYDGRWSRSLVGRIHDAVRQKTIRTFGSVTRIHG